MYLKHWIRERSIADLMGRVSRTLLLYYVVYSFGQCVLYLEPGTGNRDIAELMGMGFNNSSALLCCVLR